MIMRWGLSAGGMLRLEVPGQKLVCRKVMLE